MVLYLIICSLVQWAEMCDGWALYKAFVAAALALPAATCAEERSESALLCGVRGQPVNSRYHFTYLNHRINAWCKYAIN